ncbi:MAG TPA: hypothetical protein VGQ76_02630 [Thermoanaerobaculia bacterium]|nr:hypothetical protein [Thermoanaerobaculia bacterium]
MIRAVALSVLALLLSVGAARADVAMAWSQSAGTIVVAHPKIIEGFDRSGEKKLWSAEGLVSPSSIVTSQDGKVVAILDGFEDQIALVTVANGAVALYEAPGTPVAAAFFGRDAWVTLRDLSRVLRITPDGVVTEFEVAMDPALIAVSDLFVFVYSRAEGLLQEIDPKSGQVTRNVVLGAGGSDLEIRPPRPFDPPGAMAYLCRPTAGRIVVVDLNRMEIQERGIGAAPADLTFVEFGAQLLSFDPGTSVIADPVRESLHIAHNPNVPGQNSQESSQPTPVDRVVVTGAGLFAFDSGNGILYRIEKRATTKVASGLTATSFVPTNEALFTWDAKAGKPRREKTTE